VTDDTETTETPNPHLDHITQEPCDDCAAEMKRLAFISAVAGAAVGLGLALALVKSRG